MFGKNKEHVDHRLYVHNSDTWKVKVKDDWNKECCYYKKEDEEFFHGLVKGEIYFFNGSEKLCLNCALVHHVVSDNRTHWQKESGDFVEEISYEEAEKIESPQGE